MSVQIKSQQEASFFHGFLTVYIRWDKNFIRLAEVW